jgi:hypothetical protein
MDLYVITECAVYRYDAVNHSLIVIERGDYRGEMGCQEFVKDASVNLVFVHNKAKTAEFGSSDRVAFLTAVDSGILSMQAALYARSIGLGSVIRAYFDKVVVGKRLQLSHDQDALMAISIG